MLEKKKNKTKTSSCNQGRPATGMKNITEIDDCANPKT